MQIFVSHPAQFREALGSLRAEFVSLASCLPVLTQANLVLQVMPALSEKQSLTCQNSAGVVQRDALKPVLTSDLPACGAYLLHCGML